MAYKHGIYGQELATSLVPMTQIDAGLPVVFGTAPIHLASDPADANKPVLCYSYSEAVASFGYEEDYDKYTLCEAMKVLFGLYNIAPVVFVNVLDPAKHVTQKDNEEVVLVDGIGKVECNAMLSTLKVKVNAAGQNLVKDSDYTAAYDDEGKLVITALEDGALEGAATCVISYSAVDASKVKDSDVVGGVSLTTGKNLGLELIDEIYPRFGMVPGIILAPKFSESSTVAAVMRSKAASIDNRFKAVAFADIPDTAAKKYSDVYEWKNQNNYVDTFLVACWPKVSLGGTVHHMSTHLAGICNVTDVKYDSVPYKSPSNESMQIDSCLANGEEMVLSQTVANQLNAWGVVTTLNENGWKAWGNNTTAYPGNTDVKDKFLCIRRMFNWVLNTLSTTFWIKIDNPLNKRLINTIIDSANDWLNGLAAKGQILGGRVEFLSEENPTTSLMDGKVYFHVYLTPCSPAEDIEFVQEYDTSYVSTLFD